MKNLLLILWVLLFFWSCSSKQAINKFADPVLVRIADACDKRLTDSLFVYLKSNDARYRAAAALAFASIQDTTAATQLGNTLLEDNDAQVRKNAATALGQTGGIGSVNALIPALMDSDSQVVNAVLESLGKTIRKSDVNVLKNYDAKDSLTQAGLAWGFYRLGSRGLADTTVMLKEAKFLDPGYSLKTRQGAASFFGRSPLKGTGYEKNLIAAALHDHDAEVRMLATAGLRKLKTDAALTTLLKILEREKDDRVKINAIRGLTAFPFEKSRAMWIRMLQDPRASIAVAASEAVGIVLKQSDTALLNVARHTGNWRVQATLYKTFLKLSENTQLEQEVKTLYQASHSDYQKSWLLGALAQYGEIDFLLNELLKTKALVIKSSAAEALTTINNTRFPSDQKPHLLQIYRQAIADADPAVVGLVCGALADTLLWRRTDVMDLSFLYEAKKKMSLPKDIESLQPLEDAIASLEGKKEKVKLKNSFNHPIDWTLVKSIEKDQLVVLQTTKGEIVIRLLVEEAPGSTANFVALMNQHYFDKKFFHRVVPNFVIQAGCNRGDGYGSENYSIRSEFSDRGYRAGSVGMASAGKDTEGTQWFITHSATSPLDGRYTIFAEVEKGMDVVDSIEVGDQINSVSTIK